ncbi:hypothetical protein [Deinococcus ficus]|uniref:hypothetical protein n=1 Tax=Deinococcus ficus TaxID=317577 RepID=UPI00131D644F|nr:hypothetical protein [Deinococcus ficus]
MARTRKTPEVKEENITQAEVKNADQAYREQLEGLLVPKQKKTVEDLKPTLVAEDVDLMLAQDAALTREAAEAFLEDRKETLATIKKQDAELTPSLRKEQVEAEIDRLDRAEAAAEKQIKHNPKEGAK